MAKSTEPDEVRRRLTYRFAPVPDWIITHPGLDATAVRVCAYLARFQEATYRISTIGANCGGLSESTVRRAIRNLKAVGALSVEERFDEQRRQTSNLYTVAGDDPLSDVHRAVTGDRARGVSGDRGRVSPVTAKKDSVDLDVQELEKPSLDPADQAPTLSLVTDTQPTIDQRAKAISDGYWSWWKDGHGGEEPLVPFMGIRQIVKGCLKAGWPEAEVKRALAGCGGAISRASMQRERSRRSCSGTSNDPTKAAMDDGSHGLPENLRPEPGKSRILTTDEVRAFAIGSSDGKP